MKKQKVINDKLNKLHDQLINWLGLSLMILSLLLISMSTLVPFDFSVLNEISWYKLVVEFYKPSANSNDLLLNILLFIPFGFGLAGFAYLKNNCVKEGLIFMGIVFMLSMTIECLQVFLPERSTSFLDVVTNVLGGFLGFFLFKALYNRFFARFLSLVQRARPYQLAKFSFCTDCIRYLYLLYPICLAKPH